MIPRSSKRSRGTEVNQGFNIEDQRYLRKYDNPTKDLNIQLFTWETNEDEEEQEPTQHFCKVCKSKLDYHKYIDRFICSECTTVFV